MVLQVQVNQNPRVNLQHSNMIGIIDDKTNC